MLLHSVCKYYSDPPKAFVTHKFEINREGFDEKEGESDISRKITVGGLEIMVYMPRITNTDSAEETDTLIKSE